MSSILHSTYALFDHFAHRRWITIVLFVTAAWGTLMHSVVSMLGITGGLDTLVLGYSPRLAQDILTNLGSQGRTNYMKTELAFDLIFPLLYGTLLALLLVAACRRAARTRHSVILVPYAIVVCDWLENLTIVLMLVQFDASIGTLAPIASVFTVLKWWIGFLVYLPLFATRFFDK